MRRAVSAARAVDQYSHATSLLTVPVLQTLLTCLAIAETLPHSVPDAQWPIQVHHHLRRPLGVKSIAEGAEEAGQTEEVVAVQVSDEDPADLARLDGGLLQLDLADRCIEVYCSVL